jgi:hypothetical protein
MVKAAAPAQDLGQRAVWSGRCVWTVRRWLTAWARGGIAALAEAPRPGRPPDADAAYLLPAAGCPLLVSPAGYYRRILRIATV